ncbi:MAG TPA: hypothetical protein VG102_01580 [Candidatus Paceibacterota bacterium]|nr:hypothetical protein [Candidatus Paceibacterota bacterium]
MSTRSLLVALTLCAALLVALLFSSPVAHAFFEDQYENLEYALHPSPALAYEIGARHFDGTNPAEYDIDRATYFFQLAAEQDPTYPYLYHELARISFLKGNYAHALAQINFQISMHGDSEPNSYYERALIEAYMGDYADAGRDYQYFLKFDPNGWAGLNDYAWVLLKTGRPHDALDITQQGVARFPDNPWLLNTNSIALYEVGDIKDAKTQVQAAETAVANITQAQWLQAYPGNDPSIAAEGIAALKHAIDVNMHSILLASATSTVQLKQP